jgi:hypothetical protein
MESVLGNWHRNRHIRAGSPLQEAGTFPIAPAFGGARTTQVHDQREYISALIRCLPPERADTTQIAINRHDLCAGAGRQIAEMSGIAPDIQYPARFEFGQRRAYKFLLGGDIRVGVTAGIMNTGPLS